MAHRGTQITLLFIVIKTKEERKYILVVLVLWVCCDGRHGHAEKSSCEPDGTVHVHVNVGACDMINCTRTLEADS